MPDESNLVLKYFDLLDEFVRVRLLQDVEFARIVGSRIGNKSQYRSAVIGSSLPDFEHGIRPKLRILEEEYDPLTIEDLLYQICIDVNPGLEIHQVALPAQELDGANEDDAGVVAGFAPLPRRILDLERRLRKRVVGQDEAVVMLARAVQKASIGLKRPNAPVGTFFLVGRTGTGKTEIAKALAEILFEKAGRLVRIDCSEYALPHEYSKLIGSPPGYIGHSEGGYLTEAVKAKKECVVLFDEVEKAHDKVHNLLLQILDEGILTDSKGETVDFTKTIVLLTSNVGVDEIDRVRGRMGFDSERRQSLSDIDHKGLTIESLRKNFRPEFLNRIDETIVFNPLDVEVCARIAGRMLNEIGELIAPRGFRLRFTAGVRRYLADKGFSEEYGARELRRLIKREVEDPLAGKILDGEVQPGEISVRMKGGAIQIAAGGTRTATTPA